MASQIFNRHPELTFRSTVQLGKERAVINKEKLLHWFLDLTAYVHDEIKAERILLDPTRLYNADETGLSLCPNKNSKVVGSKGAPVVYHFGNSDKTQMTVMAAASASGHFIPPMIIYPGQRFSYNPLDGFEEAAFGRSENGWMDSEVFIGWLKNVFIPAVNAWMVKKPLILFIDGHKTHVTMEASDACIENGIELYCLLEHSSHIIQPLDLRFFGSLKSAWRQSVRDWQAQHIGEFVTKQTFARVLKPAWDASATVDAAVKGFRDAGLFPFNSSAVVDSVKLDRSQLFSSKLSSSGNCVDLSTSNISQSIRLPAEPTISSPSVSSTALNQPVPSTIPTSSVPPSAPTPSVPSTAPTPPVPSRAPNLPAPSTAPTPPVPPTDFSDVVANVTSSDPHAATVGLTEVDSQVTDRTTSPMTSGNPRSNDSNTHSPFSKFLSIPKPKTN